MVEGECPTGTSPSLSRPRVSHVHSSEGSEGSSGEAELEAELGTEQEAGLEAEPDTSDPEDVRDQPGALLFQASQIQNLPAMAAALAHGADVNATNAANGGRTPLIQAVVGVSPRLSCTRLLL